jgi:uncharacterized protein
MSTKAKGGFSMPTGHGNINWTELWTSDLKKAQAHYGKILGWTFQEMPGSGGSYVMAKLGDETVCGLFEWQDPQSNRWFTHFTVDDADAAVATNAADGGMTIKPAFDIPGIGRVAIVADATGTMFGVIRPV